MLEKELAKYNAIKGELLQQNPQGGFVVINGESVLGVWQNRMDALKEGVKVYGNVSFLVKDINENTLQTINFSRDIKFIDAIPQQPK